MAKKPDMSRNNDLAGQTVSKDGYNITYNENGYATSAVKTGDGRAAAASVDAVTGGGGDRASYGGSTYDQQYFSDSELAAAAAARAAAEAGETDWDSAHAYVEGIRANYGYSGDTDGSRYIPLAQEEEVERFSYSSAPSYTSKYSSQIDELTQALLNREAFSYDYTQDPLYHQYAETYTREGNRAMQDTIGQVAARTGGLASSYATTAGQQANNVYMAALSDKIPELQQLAYDMYMDEGDKQLQNIQLLMALEEGDYAKYQDLLAQYNTDRDFAYGVFSDDRAYDYQLNRDAIADQRYDTEWEYGVGRDAIADQRYDTEWAYQVGQDSKNDAQERIDNYLAAGGKASGLDAELVAQAGYTQAELAAIESYYTQQAAAKNTGGSGGGGTGGGSGGGGNTGTGGGDDTSGNANMYQSLYDSGIRTEGDAYAYLLASGYNTTQAGKLAGYFSDWLDAGGGKEEPSDGTEDYTIENRHGDSWIYIPGHGRFSYQEVYNYVESGQVKETVNADGTIRYTWVNK